MVGGLLLLRGWEVWVCVRALALSEITRPIGKATGLSVVIMSLTQRGVALRSTPALMLFIYADTSNANIQ